jgi:hypothetical protein
MRTVVYRKPSEVTDTLAGLDLSFEILRDAMLAGETARDSCSANDPRNAPGFDAWARTVRSLRGQLVTHGWTPDDEDGLPSIISPAGDVAIVVATGDQATGKADDWPKTKYRNGPARIVVVERNRNQLHLFDPRQKEKVKVPKLKTYFLLRCRIEDMVYSELSIPASIGDDGRVDEWIERVILEPFSVNPESGPSSSDQGDEIEVNVRRRQK